MDIIDYSKEPYSYYTWVDCPNCSMERGKKGRIRRYKQIADGKCFTCDGRGTLDIEEAKKVMDSWLRSLWKSDCELNDNRMTFQEYKNYYFCRQEQENDLFAE